MVLEVLTKQEHLEENLRMPNGHRFSTDVT